jgi:hypothetical protein
MTVDEVRKISEQVNDLLNGKFDGDRSAAEMGLANHLVFYGFTRVSVGSILVGISQIGKAAEKVAAGFTDYVDNTVDRAFADTTDRYTPNSKSNKKATKVMIGDTEYDDMATACDALAKVALCNRPWFIDNGDNFWSWNDESMCYERGSVERMVSHTVGIVPELGNILSVPIWNTTYKNTIKAYGYQVKRIPKPVPDEWVNFMGGAYDILKSEEIVPTPAHFWKPPIPWKMGDSTETPIIDGLVADWVDDKDTQLGLLEAACYPVFNGYPIPALIMLIGHGRNGKSQYCKIVQKFVGEMGCTAYDLHKLESSRFEASSLYQMRAGIADDIGRRKLTDTGNLKMLVDGATYNFEFKGKDPISAKSTAKLFANANAMPDTNDNSDGFNRKVKMIEFVKEFEEVEGGDQDIMNSIPDSEYENLLRRAVTELLPALIKRGAFTGFPDKNENKERAKRWSDNPVAAFIEDVGYTEDRGSIKEEWVLRDQFIMEFSEWMGDADVGDPASRKYRQTMTKALTSLGFNFARRGKENVYVIENMVTQDGL